MSPEHFSLHEVATGVWAAEADLMGASVGNAAIIDLGGKTVIFDTFMTSVAARELRTTAEHLTGSGAFLAVNSHWHSDHSGGNQEFAEAPIVATPRTMELIIENAPDDLDAWEAEVDGAIAELDRAASDGDENARRRLAGLGHIKESIPGFKLTLPDLLVDGRLVVEGERRLVLETRGAGHTDSDLFAWLPDEKVVATGDLCWNGIHPRLRDGHPEPWADYVAALLELEPTTVVPGHGPPGDRGALEPLPDYFRAVAGMVSEVRAGADPEDLAPPAASTGWAGLARLHTGLAKLAER